VLKGFQKERKNAERTLKKKRKKKEDFEKYLEGLNL